MNTPTPPPSSEPGHSWQAHAAAQFFAVSFLSGVVAVVVAAFGHWQAVMPFGVAVLFCWAATRLMRGLKS